MRVQYEALKGRVFKLEKNFCLPTLPIPAVISVIVPALTAGQIEARNFLVVMAVTFHPELHNAYI